ncbi:PREDICTED: uncharacterized protein LOC109580683 [Amphimedon queenslandica]|uniref:Uncharacterized protein n=1 Tax=Amphimedon queenslandica TaxID=400682 RepID=A0A1X7VC26_AMPQE|nr:PREDICTED: uncharacterized protein LOC109580683 [Amphimedon queenslandica]|eukprot:XP_019849683.1 PREDICTED: uncharacterized protein LOC109580683 [Amphimedon queenslandica]
MPALAVLPFVLLLQTLISIPNSITFVLRDELNIDNSLFVNETGPAVFKRKLTGIASPLYAELAEGVMSYRVQLYHEHNLEKVYYYTEDCNGDLSVTTDSNLATTFVIETGDKFYQKGGKFTIGCYPESSTTPRWIGVREETDGDDLYLTADATSTNFKVAVGEITPYYMKSIV